MAKVARRWTLSDALSPMRCLVVYCHPVPESFGAAVRDTAVAALSDRGFEVRLVDLYAEGFDPVLSADERRNMDRAPTDPELAPHIENLKWATGDPVRLSDLVARPAGHAEGLVRPRLGDRCSVTACRRMAAASSRWCRISRRSASSPPAAQTWWLSFLMGQPGRKTILRGIRSLCALQLPYALSRTLRHGPLDAGNARGLSTEV